MQGHLDRIHIILHRPLQPGNVGSAARAMKNMGLRRLRLVSPCDLGEDMARWMAVSAAEILDRAEIFEDLGEALRDLHLVIGTIPPDRPRFQARVHTPASLASRLLRQHPGDRIGILFGPEDNGLSNRELDLCHEFVSIRSHPDFPSLNLAQALMVITYEIYSAIPGDRTSAPPPMAEAETLEGMYDHLRRTLIQIGFLNPENPGHIMRDLRRIFGRARLDTRELRILRGILRQTQWAATHGAPERDSKPGGPSGAAGTAGQPPESSEDPEG